jgi:hypothetical protein
MKEILNYLFGSLLVVCLLVFLDKTRHDLISAQADIAHLQMENGNLANRVTDYESKEVVENAYMVDVMHGGKE